MTDAELTAIVDRKQIESYRRRIIAANKRRAYESEHQKRLREVGGPE